MGKGKERDGKVRGSDVMWKRRNKIIIKSRVKLSIPE